ncbi:MAG: hypothetical protein DRI22_01050 [Caldiserica bacterium]|nr:MAG: hypothetical protein DRI22_01050 [Caldisericota bacterium]
MIVLVCENTSFLCEGLFQKIDCDEPEEIMDKLSSHEDVQFYVVGSPKFVQFVGSLTSKPVVYLGESIKKEFTANYQHIVFRLSNGKFVILKRKDGGTSSSL